MDKKSEIKLVDESLSHTVGYHFEQNRGFYSVKSSVWIYYTLISEQFDNVYTHDIHDVEYDIYIGNKRVFYKGYKKLLEQLFGEKEAEQVMREMVEEFSNEWLKHNKYKIIEDLNRRQLEELFKEFSKDEQFWNKSDKHECSELTGYNGYWRGDYKLRAVANQILKLNGNVGFNIVNDVHTYKVMKINSDTGRTAVVRVKSDY